MRGPNQERIPLPARLQRWHDEACPWEETRHSGFFSDFDDADQALAYAAARVCIPRGRVDELSRLAGARIYFMGDSVMRQFAQATMCRLRHSAVVSDNMNWSTVWPNRKWGECGILPGPAPQRHCFMRDGCVVLRHDVRICYQSDWSCMAAYAHFSLSTFLSQQAAVHGVGAHNFAVFSHGSHSPCKPKYWPRLNASFRKSMRRSGIPPERLSMVYKESDATHFPTRSGVFVNHTDRFSKWRCKPVNTSDPLPETRAAELKMGLPTLRHLGWHVLETFDVDQREGAYLHATHAKVPSNTMPVDCLHWMLPGVPDVWVEKLLQVVTAQSKRNAPVARAS